MQHTISPHQSAALVETLVAQCRSLFTAFVAQVPQQPLDHLEAQVQQVSQQVAHQVLTQTVAALAPAYPAATQPCPCGAQAVYQRQRQATVQTTAGRIRYRRPYYLCGTCHQGQSPFDAAVGWCAGSVSAAVQQQAALLGASLPFAQAAHVLTTLTGVTLSPPTVRRATQQVGHQVETLPPVPLAQPLDPLYLGADGVMVHLREEGWKEVRVGCGFTSQPHATPQGPGLRAEQMHYLTEVGSVDDLGARLWEASVAWGGEQAQQVVVLGDGAAWIDGLAQTYWPQATRIVDWYHAAHYVHEAAQALAARLDAPAWLAQMTTQLWQGQVNAVLDALHEWAWAEEAVRRAETYLIRHRTALQYATFRAHGLQIGSGVVESACKQVVQARCKGAGMRWSRIGVRRVLAVRACLLSHQWETTRPRLVPPTRAYHCCSAF